MAEESLQLTGLALPAERRAGGYFSVRSEQEVIWGDLLLAILTPIGARPMNRRFGSSLHLILDEPNDGGITQQVEFALQEAVRRWVPHAELYGVKVRQEQRAIEVTVAFGSARDAQVATRTFAVPMTQSATAGGA